MDHVSHPGSDTIADAIGFAVAQPYELPVGNAHRSCIGKSQLVTYKPAYHCAERPAESGAVDNAISGTFTFPYSSAESEAVCDKELRTISGGIWGAFRGRQQQS